MLADADVAGGDGVPSREGLEEEGFGALSPPSLHTSCSTTSHVGRERPSLRERVAAACQLSSGFDGSARGEKPITSVKG